MPRTEPTVSPVAPRIVDRRRVMSSFVAAIRPASDLMSLTTAAKLPPPAAREACTVALSASAFVCAAISAMARMMASISAPVRARPSALAEADCAAVLESAMTSAA